MTGLYRDTLDRTLKLELDEGRAANVEEAEALVRQHVLQVVVGRGVGASKTRQALLVTVLNTGARAFIGGVRVRLVEDATLAIPWHEEARVSEILERYAATLTEDLDNAYPTIVVGDSEELLAGVVLHPTWEGWAAGCVRQDDARLAEEQELTVSGVLAGALAVSEAFQQIRGNVIAGHRDVGLSLWDLRCDWRDEHARGPRRFYLPDSLWLAGLGHLGQAYAWVLGLLPYPNHGLLELTLQDVDHIVAANAATSLLADAQSFPQGAKLGARKTRLVATRLEQLGAKTTIVERFLDEHTYRQDGEPPAIIAGFDDPAPRRLLESAGFARAFDAGLGRGPKGYLEIMIHSFPSQVLAKETFPEQRTAGRAGPKLQPAYDRLVEALIEEGMTPEQARCGVVEEIAGRSVAASFVGAVAACLVVAELLRDLHGAQRYAIVDLSLREPQARQVVELTGAIEPANYGSVANAAD